MSYVNSNQHVTRICSYHSAQERYLDPNKSYWAALANKETWSIARKLTAGVMSSVRAGLTEPLQRFETMLTIQHILDDGSQWYRHTNR